MLKKVTPAGLIISEELIHQGVGEDKMLACFHCEPCSLEEALNRWRIDPVVLQTQEASTLKSIFNETHTDCFAVSELDLEGEFSLKGHGNFFVAVVYNGKGTILCDGNESSFEQGDEIFFSAAIKEIKFNSEIKSKILLCYPPC